MLLKNRWKREFFQYEGLFALTSKFFFPVNFTSCQWLKTELTAVEWFHEKSSPFLDVTSCCIAILGFIRCGISEYSSVSWLRGDILLCKLEVWAPTTKGRHEESWSVRSHFWKSKSSLHCCVYPDKLGLCHRGMITVSPAGCSAFLTHMQYIPCECCCRIIFSSSLNSSARNHWRFWKCSLENILSLLPLFVISF